MMKNYALSLLTLLSLSIALPSRATVSDTEHSFAGIALCASILAGGSYCLYKYFSAKPHQLEHPIAIEHPIEHQRFAAPVLRPLPQHIAPMVIHVSSKTTLEIVQGDITEISADAIVNAANQRLQGGGGVCGAIFNAAGEQELQKACDTIGHCPTGQACITDACNLKAKSIKYIIHAVGPDCRIIQDHKERHDLLYSTYYKSLEIADAQKGAVRSVSFPWISAAIYACPRDLAADTALEAMRDYIIQHPNTHITHIRMVLFSAKDTVFFMGKARDILK